jgi:hypothetical protein
VSRKQAHQTEEATRDQAQSDQWWKERRLRLTASNFAEICRYKKVTAQNLLNAYRRSKLYREKSLYPSNMEKKMNRLQPENINVIWSTLDIKLIFNHLV